MVVTGEWVSFVIWCFKDPSRHSPKRPERHIFFERLERSFNLFSGAGKNEQAFGRRRVLSNEGQSTQIEKDLVPLTMARFGPLRFDADVGRAAVIGLDIKVDFALATHLLVIIPRKCIVGIPRMRSVVPRTSDCADDLVHNTMKVVFTEGLSAFANIVKLKLGRNPVREPLPDVFSLHSVSVVGQRPPVRQDAWIRGSLLGGR